MLSADNRKRFGSWKDSGFKKKPTVDGAGDNRFSRCKNNWKSVIDRLEGHLRQEYTIAETVLTLRVPDHVRVQVYRTGNLWLQCPKFGDKNNERVFVLNPDIEEIGNVVRSLDFVDGNNSNTTISTPSSGAQESGSIPASFMSSSIRFSTPSATSTSSNATGGEKRKLTEEEELVENIKVLENVAGHLAETVAKQQAEVLQKEMEWAGLEGSTRDSEGLHNAKMGKLKFESEQSLDKWKVTNKELETRRDELRRLRVNAEKNSKSDFKKYQDDCSKLIGWLQSKCDTELIDQMKTNEEYINAVELKDIVKVAYIIKMCVLDAETDNVQETNFRRLTYMMNEKLKKVQDFSSFAHKYLETYKEFHELGGTIGDEMLISALSRNIGECFGTLGNNWIMNLNKEKPLTIADAFNVLRHAYNRVGSEGSGDVSPKKALVASHGGGGKKVPGGQGGGKSDECFNFQKSGNCKFGDSCKFRHGKQNSSNSPQKAMGLMVCTHVLEQGVCYKGERCVRASCHAVSKHMFDKHQMKKVVQSPASHNNSTNQGKPRYTAEEEQDRFEYLPE